MVLSNPWCTVCCTRHAPDGECPGSLLATGPERHARKFNCITKDNKVEYYGILIAPSGDLWRARIFTYPDVLWSVPDGAGKVKFVGATAREAESRAIEYVEVHCTERESKLTEAAENEMPHPGKNVAPKERHPCKVPIRFGEEMAIQTATTANFSTTGVYIATDKLIAKGKRLHMALSVQAYTIALTGTVMWVRHTDEPGKPKGMGVKLDKPPALYLRYVEEVRETSSKS